MIENAKEQVRMSVERIKNWKIPVRWCECVVDCSGINWLKFTFMH